MRSLHYRFYWIALYIIINIIAAFIIISKGEHIGDLRGLAVDDVGNVIASCISISFSYFIVLFILFELFLKFKFRPVLPLPPSLQSNSLKNIISVTLLIFQVLFLLYNQFFGAGIAGVDYSDSSQGILKYLWVFLPVDLLFLIYYGYFRDEKYFKINLIVWLISNVSRGWSGCFMTILFMELYYFYNRRGLTLKAFCIALVLCLSILFCYPVIYALKNAFRSGAGSDVLLSLNYLSSMTIGEYIGSILYGLEHLVGRIQLVSILAEISNIKAQINDAIFSGSIRPFWSENLFGIITDHIFYGYKRDDITVFAANSGLLPMRDISVVSNTNINISFPAWFVISPLLSILYIPFVLANLLISVYLVKKIGLTDGSKIMLWFSWLSYALPPWWAAFFKFNMALMIFLLFYWLLVSINKTQKY